LALRRDSAPTELHEWDRLPYENNVRKTLLEQLPNVRWSASLPEGVTVKRTFGVEWNDGTNPLMALRVNHSTMKLPYLQNLFVLRQKGPEGLQYSQPFVIAASGELMPVPAKSAEKLGSWSDP
jgi:hypothetical protein